MPDFRFNEKYLSQIPALQQLINLGFEYITPEQAMMQRGGQLINVLLEDTLRVAVKPALTVSVTKDASTGSVRKTSSRQSGKSGISPTRVCKKPMKRCMTC